ncbi:hypothetical protein CcCBS67573_g02685 [Chytriomyces confervae]|uniref:BAR domain-containing protein n=1 Tax=Chytriomyces confervae TaxID=246404 RepID=A0A507FLZ3_9FUNG|nr:hypothetical protein CcCBS67573_g02685 [Chytriomyces confervae]
MSLRGFSKAVARLPHLVMSKSGYSSETTDPEYTDLEERFKLLDASARKLSEDSKKFKDALSSLLAHQESFAATLLEVYSPITPHLTSPVAADGESPMEARISSGSKSYKQTEPISLQAAQEFANFSQATRQFLLPDLETIERRLVAPSMDLVLLLDNVKKVIIKRGHKLLDYDRHREAVKKLKEKERSVSDEKSLGKAEIAFDQASREYNHINNLLKSELPVLLQLKAPFIDPCFQTLFWYQLKVHQVLSQAYGDLIKLPAFDVSLSAAVGFETKVAAQAALLDDLSLVYRNRKSVPSNNPLSPDYVAPGLPDTADASSPHKFQSPQHAEPPSYATSSQHQSVNSFKQLHGSYGSSIQHPPLERAYPETEDPSATFVTALYDYQAQADGDLSFMRDDRIELIERTADPNDWWTGRLRGATGIFPGNYVA